jgi:hypothetical protein
MEFMPIAMKSASTSVKLRAPGFRGASLQPPSGSNYSATTETFARQR